MCLYPRLIQNPKYKENAKNGGVIPAIRDNRVLAVPIGCGECMECRKKKAREWQIRLSEEIRNNDKGIFVTLTFSNEAFTKYSRRSKLKGYEKDNDIAKEAIRHFLERWRKKYKKSVKHWLITELGHNGTENIHMHGIIWTDKEPNEIRNIWKNGFVWLGNQKSDGSIQNYVSERTVNYIIKYVHKTDELHKGFKSKILCSKGIGSGYMKRGDKQNNVFKEGKTNETYTLKNGNKTALPIYYRNKIYTEDEREKLWLEKLDKKIRYVGGEKVDISINEDEYYKLREWYRERNRRLGYGDGNLKNKDKEYEEARRKYLHDKREANTHERPASFGTPDITHKAINEGKESAIGWGNATDRWDNT